MRTVLCSLGGAAVGFVVGAFVIVAVASCQGGGAEGLAAGCAIAGMFLAGLGAIAGAVIGGVADLLAYWRKRERQERKGGEQCG